MEFNGPQTILEKNKSALAYKKRLAMLILALLLLLPVDAALVSAAEDPLIVGVFPRKGFKAAIRTFTPLASYLEQKLGRKVILESAPNFSAFWIRVKSKRYHLVHFNQYHYVRIHKENSYDVIVKNEEKGKSTMSGVLFVRKDSGIRNVEDLRGKKIVFGGGPTAMQSYIVATHLLKKGGLRKGEYIEEYARSPANAIMAAYFGQAAAAGSADANLQLSVVRKRIDIDKMHTLSSGAQLAHLPWAVRYDMESDLRAKLRELMIDLVKSDEGRAILHAADVTAFQPAQDSEYDPHRLIIKEVLGEEY